MSTEPRLHPLVLVLNNGVDSNHQYQELWTVRALEGAAGNYFETKIIPTTVDLVCTRVACSRLDYFRGCCESVGTQRVKAIGGG